MTAVLVCRSGCPAADLVNAGTSGAGREDDLDCCYYGINEEVSVEGAFHLQVRWSARTLIIAGSSGAGREGDLCCRRGR